MNDELIARQIEYYDHRALEYPAPSATDGDLTENYVGDMEAALAEFCPKGKVLEIACGPGRWTARLLQYADEVLAVDASPRMLERARSFVTDERARFERADIFEWEPPTTYDAVFFSFWVSHVPDGRFEWFWDLVARALEPEGRVFFIDERPHDFWAEESVGENLVRRHLSDGSEHVIVKKFWEPADLQRELGRLGWRVEITAGGPFFWGWGSRTWT